MIVLAPSYSQGTLSEIGSNDARYASLSGGRFNEHVKARDIEQYGSTLFDTKAKKILAFLDKIPAYNNYMFDPVIFAWNVDPMAHKFPHASPYNFVENNPISRVDPTGAEWVNAYDTRVAATQKALLVNPNDKQLKKELAENLQNQIEVNNILQTMKQSDPDLYNYIDNLSVTTTKHTGEKALVNVQAIVELNSRASSVVSNALATTDRQPNVTLPAEYNGKEIGAPITLSKPHAVGFNITLYNNLGQDVSLANEAGDIMYFMEYNQKAIKEGGDVGKTWSEYMQPGSGGDYSSRVEELYKGRKNEAKRNPEAIQSRDNPYPIQNR